MKRTTEHFEHCKAIASKIDNYINGLMYKCPNCGEVFENPDFTLCPDCEDELEELSLYDYFEDALDIEYRIGSNKEFRSVKILVACGGPNIWIDTATGQVVLRWWDEGNEALLSDNAIEAINDIFEEYYHMTK